MNKNELAELRDRLIELDESYIEVTKWESDFIDNVLDQGGRWTERQIETIEKILEKYAM
jgi:hypothetical protein